MRSMAIKFGCHSCGSRWNAPDKAAGRETKCPRCGTVLRVPLPTDQVPPNEPPAAAAPIQEVEELEVVDSEEVFDELEVVDEVAEVLPVAKAEQKQPRGFLRLQKFIIESPSGGSHGTAENDIIDPDTDQLVGYAKETGTARSMSILGARSSFAATIEVYDAAGDRLLFLLERPGQFLSKPRAEVRDTQDRLLGVIESGAALLKVEPEIYGRCGQLLAQAEIEGDRSRRKWVFWGADDQKLASVTVLQMRRRGALLAAAQGGRYSVACAASLAAEPDLKLLVLAAALFIDLVLVDAINRPIPPHR
jgi:hypothetical protein